MQETHVGTTHVKGHEGCLPEGQACPTLGIGRELSCHPRPRMAVTLGEPSHGQRADHTHHNWPSLSSKRDVCGLSGSTRMLTHLATLGLSLALRTFVTAHGLSLRYRDSQAMVCGLSCSTVCGILVLQTGIKHGSLELKGGPSGKSPEYLLTTRKNYTFTGKLGDTTLSDDQNKKSPR